MLIGTDGKAQQLYQLHCKNEVLRLCLPATELEAFAGTFKLKKWGDSLITLREAAKLQAPWNAFTTNVCNCTGGCSTRCSCCKKGIDCSSRCHHGNAVLTCIKRKSFNWTCMLILLCLGFSVSELLLCCTIV